MDSESKAYDYGVCGAESLQGSAGPRRPRPVPWATGNAPFYQCYIPALFKLGEVLKAEDLRQPQLIEFEIRSLGFCLDHKPGCQVSGSTSESGFRI